MKFIIILFTTIGLLNSCSSKTEIERLNTELTELKINNTKLKTQLTKYENSIVINANELDEYIMPVTFGPMEVNRNEKSTFETHLVLRKLPNNVQTDWTCTPEGMAIKKDGLIHYVSNTFESERKLEFRGKYELTFPNGENKKLNWIREFNVK